MAGCKRASRRLEEGCRPELDARRCGGTSTKKSPVTCLPTHLGPDDPVKKNSMFPRSVLNRSLTVRRIYPGHALRRVATAGKTSNVKPIANSPLSDSPSPSAPTAGAEPNERSPPQSWLTRAVRSSPIVRRIFFGVAQLLGYETSRQVAGRRAFVMYEKVCVPRADEDNAFWREGMFTDSRILAPIISLASVSLPSATNIPVVVYYNQPPHLAAHRPSSRPANAPCGRIYPSTHRPLLYRR